MIRHAAVLKAGMLATAVLALVAVPEPATAQTGIDGSLDVTARAGYWSSSRRLDDERNLAHSGLWAKGSLRPAEDVTLLFDGFASMAYSSRETRPFGDLRDAYMRIDRGPVELRVGWQSFAWGRADRINPTDVLGVRDLTLLVPTVEAQRVGTPAVKLGYALDDATQAAIYIQRFRANRMPTVARERPYSTVSDRRAEPEIAVKLERATGSIDWSVSSAWAYDKTAALGLALSPFAAPSVVRDHARVHMLGADGATTIGGVGVRGEVAYTRVTEGIDPRYGGRSSNLSGVAGMDYNLDENHNVNVQYLFRRNFDFTSPEWTGNPLLTTTLRELYTVNGQSGRFQSGVSTRLSYAPFDGATTWELQAMLDFNSGDVAFQPRLTRRLHDRLTLNVGGDVYTGRSNSFFGQLRKNNLIFTELQWLL